MKRVTILAGTDQQARDYARERRLERGEFATPGSLRALEGLRTTEFVILPGFNMRRDAAMMWDVVQREIVRMARS